MQSDPWRGHKKQECFEVNFAIVSGFASSQ